MKQLFSLLVALSLYGCGVSQAEHDEVLADNKALLIQIDELKYGEVRLIAIIDQTFENREYDRTKKAFSDLKVKHPQSKTIPKYTKLMTVIKEREETTRKKNAIMEKLAQEDRAKKLKEKNRLANLNNTGVWQVTKYVDDFGDPTNKKYIRNPSLIRGRFSNSATQNSELDVRFLISNKTDVNIMMFEYAGNNPVKAYSPDTYSVQLQDNNGERFKLNATNYGDRLSFGPKHSNIIWSALLRGGKVSLRIFEIDNPTNQYAFEVSNANYFENAARILSKGS